MAIENLEMADFEHTLAILPHGGKWYVYIDEPSQWWRAYDSLDLVAAGVASTLERLLVHKHGQKIKYARHPLSNNRAGTFPAQTPRWRVRVTADCGEEQAEWQVEMLDDSAWSMSGYDLKECLGKLGRRLQFAAGTQFEPQQIVTVPPPEGRTVTAPVKVASVSPTGTIEDVLTARLEAIGPEIAEQEKRRRDVTLEIEKKLADLRTEQRAVTAARSAYREKTYKHRKREEANRPEAIGQV